MKESSTRSSASASRVLPKTQKISNSVLLFMVLIILVCYQITNIARSPSFGLDSFEQDHMYTSMPCAKNFTTYSKVSRNTTTIATMRWSRRRRQKSKRVKIPLANLTASLAHPENCVHPLQWIQNKEMAQRMEWPAQRIPLIIHQTSKSRCVHRSLARDIDKWRSFPQYSYYFHDDAAVWRLIDQDWPEFPHLGTVVRCLVSMTAVCDIWRLLVLFEYGGIYSDLDSIPQSWTPSYIHHDDDAYFVVEQYDAPSQYFMAVSPRHPLVFYAIHHALSNIMTFFNTQKIDAAYVTGPFALLDGLSWFMLDKGVITQKPLGAGVYKGRYGRSIRLDGHGRERSDEIIKRESMTRAVKRKKYQTMNMTHFRDDLKAGYETKKLGRSCFAIAYDILIGPPEWYAPTDGEDRTTVGGTF